MLARLLPDELEPARIGRVTHSSHGALRVVTVDGPTGAIVAPSIREKRDPIVVGDWVVLRLGDPVVAYRRVERTTTLARRDPAGGVQVVAANVDRAIVCTAADRDWNLRRVERWLAVVADSGAEPALLITKADLHPDPAALLAELRVWSPDLPAAAVSRVTGIGRDDVLGLLEPGKTASFLGSSGVGKSTLVNWILGEETQEIGELRRDGRGRHTTTDRHLFHLPNGAWLLDNPGVREVGPVSEAGIAEAFPEIEEAADACRFRDCHHDTEPGCRIRTALEAGTIDPERLAAWRKLLRELAFEERRADPAAQAAARKRPKQIHKAHKRRDAGREEW